MTQQRREPKVREPSWIELIGTIITSLPNFAETGCLRLFAIFLLLLSPLVCMGSAVSWYIYDWKGEVFTYSLPVIAVAIAGAGIWIWKASGKIDDVEKIERLFAPAEERPALSVHSEPPPAISGEIEHNDYDDEGVINA